MREAKKILMSLWEDYLKVRVISDSPARVRHADLIQLLEDLLAVNPQAMAVEQLGESFEDRSISCLTLGNGQVRVLAWSQMHGNEPTHTAVLLSLVNLLQRFPKHPSAETILAGCTLYFVPMLNPDGVERYTRRNAQDIDINRDALHLQSPEGRLLKQVVEEVKPHFALNLHNQQPRTSASAASRQAATVSLLVPPVNQENTETSEVRRAKQVAAVFLQAVQPYCEGMISRYDADFMPRCFGECVQQQGVPTLTVEAGGWSTLDPNAIEIEQIHFVGLVAALESIAKEHYLQADPADYDSLPRSGDHDLFDLMLRGITVANGGSHSAFVADLGINLASASQCRTPISQATIVDMGDLCVTNGKISIDGNELACLPGRISFASEISPCRLPSSEQLREFAAMGVTTVIGQVDLADASQLDALAKLDEQYELPINMGFVATVHALQEQQSFNVRGQLLKAVSLGVLGVLAEGISDDELQCLKDFQVPCLSTNEMLVATQESVSLEDYAAESAGMATRLGLEDRGKIEREMAADLILIGEIQKLNARSTISWGDLQQVMVAGTVVFNGSELTGGTSGAFLKNRLTSS